ncbi:MAG: flavin-containing monooxygenase [Alphaproteobacteria bacterium]
MNEMRAAAPKTVTDLTGAARGRKHIGIVGAGAAGLCTAKYMKQAGFDVTLFEIGTQIGGLWCFRNDSGRSSAYSTLHINTSKGVTHFHDLDFDPDVQDFPDHRDMHRYLVQYADRFGVTPHIRFKSEVIDVRPAFTPGREAPRWEVETVNGEVFAFDAVCVATGHLTKPMHVPMFRDEFKGEYVHSQDYKDPAPFLGKRVCIVGVGNSACDISGDLCATAPRCVLVARSGVIVLPKLLFGLPFTDISNCIQQAWIPQAIRRRLIRFLTWIAHGDMQKLGFKPVGQRTHVTSNGTIVTDIRYNRMQIKHGIERIEGKTIHFSDGTAEEFDTLIAATGYLIELPFIKPEVVPLTGNRIDLWQRMVPPDWPGLYFVGMLNPDTALNMLYERQVPIIRDIELGTFMLPSRDEMWEDIRRKEAWVKRHYKDTPRHTIEEEHIPYFMGLRKARLQSWLRMRRRGAAAAETARAA